MARLSKNAVDNLTEIALWLFVGVVVLWLMVLGLGGLVGDARAHSFYEWRCCHDRDCRSLPPGAVQVTTQGYRVLGRLVPWGDSRIREIPPEATAEEASKFHVCTTNGEEDSLILCLYVPTGGA